MANKVYLKYSFIFDKGETWSEAIEFDTALGKFFDERGLLVEVVEPLDSEFNQLRIVYISKKPEIEIPEDNPQTSKKKLKTASIGRDFKGKFKKNG